MYKERCIVKIAADSKKIKYCRLVRKTRLRCIQRSMDRSLRKSNPDCYESDGTLRKGCVLKKTKGYEKRIQRLQECHRKAAATRRCEHGQLINLLLSMAGDIRVEKNQWKAFQKGHFGKSLGKSGISGLLKD